MGRLKELSEWHSGRLREYKEASYTEEGYLFLYGFSNLGSVDKSDLFVLNVEEVAKLKKLLFKEEL